MGTISELAQQVRPHRGYPGASPGPGGMEFTVLNRYAHRRRDVDAAIGWLFLNGVSTRKLKGLARELFGQEVSAQTVSNTWVA